MNEQETYHELMQRHRRATLVALMRHGDLSRDRLTTADLATVIGMPTADLHKYITENKPPSYVDGLVARWLSVSIRNWNKTAAPVPVKGVV